MIETFISVLGAANTVHDSFNKISGISPDKIQMAMQALGKFYWIFAPLVCYFRVTHSKTLSKASLNLAGLFPPP